MLFIKCIKPNTWCCMSCCCLLRFFLFLSLQIHFNQCTWCNLSRKYITTERLKTWLCKNFLHSLQYLGCTKICCDTTGSHTCKQLHCTCCNEFWCRSGLKTKSRIVGDSNKQIYLVNQFSVVDRQYLNTKFSSGIFILVIQSYFLNFYFCDTKIVSLLHMCNLFLVIHRQTCK